MKTRKPWTKPFAPGLVMHFDGYDLFLVANGNKVAKRGHPGTPQAKRWISLDHPEYEVFDDPDGGFGFKRRGQ